MSRATKILLIISSIALILFDALVLFDITQAKGGKQIFELVLENMFPCKALIGISGLLFAFENPKKKIFAILTIIASGFMVLVHFFGLVLQFVDIFTGVGITNADEYIAITKFAGEIVVLVAAIFLMVYLIKGALKKTTITIAGIGFVATLVSWVYTFYNAISAFSGGLSEFFTETLTGGFDVSGIALLVVWILTFACITGMLEGLSKKREKE